MGEPPKPTLIEIERAIARAWPADEVVDIGGWLWRGSGGGFGRANSVATLGGPPADIDAAISEVERRYRACRQPVLFQVTEASLPADLGARLLARGYANSETNATLLLDLAAAPPSPAVTPADGVETATSAGAGWVDTYATVLSAERRASAPRILARVPEPRRMIGVRRDGQHLATVLVVADGPIAVVECVATRPEARRMGIARVAMEAAIAEARALGATSVALGMAATNTAARALYTGLGFVEVGGNSYFRREL